MSERPINYPRRDNGPQRVVGKHDPVDHGEKHPKIKVHTGPRKALTLCR